MTIRISFAASPERLYEEHQLVAILDCIRSAYSCAFEGRRDASACLEGLYSLYSIRVFRETMLDHKLPALEHIIEHVKEIAARQNSSKLDGK